MNDELDALYRSLLAETMRPCRELSREERARQATAHKARDAGLEETRLDAHSESTHLRAV